jgi:hypothetical protein
VDCCTLLLTWGTGFLIIRPVFKKWCHNACNTSVWNHSLSKIKMSPKILVALTAHHTPTLTSCNSTLQMDNGISTDQYLLLWEFTYSTEMKSPMWSLILYHTVHAVHKIHLLQKLYSTYALYRNIQSCNGLLILTNNAYWPSQALTNNAHVARPVRGPHNMGANNWLHINQMKYGSCMWIHASMCTHYLLCNALLWTSYNSLVRKQTGGKPD